MRMGIASEDTVILFNFRGPPEIPPNLAFISGRKEAGGPPRDGVGALQGILNDAVENHHKTCLKIPKNISIKLQSKLL